MKAGILIIGSWLGLVTLALGNASGAAGSANADPSGAYGVDGGHSSVVFRVSHLGASNFYGRFNKIDGNFTYDAEHPEKSNFEISIDPDSVDTNNERRDGHLKSPDFLNVKQFPELKFKSKSLKKSGDKWELLGDLTLHGVTKEIKAEFDWVGTAEMRGTMKGGFDAIFTVKRSDFGIDYMPDGLGDEIKIMVGIEGNKKG